MKCGPDLLNILATLLKGGWGGGGDRRQGLQLGAPNDHNSKNRQRRPRKSPLADPP